MEREEPRMNRVNCADPRENPAAGPLDADWLEREVKEAKKKSVPDQDVRFPSFCRPLRQVRQDGWNI